MRIDHLTPDDWTGIVPTRIQWLMRVLTRRPGRVLFRYRAYSTEHIPREGGFIIAPNHGSYLDSFFFAHGFTRTVRFMSKHQVLRWPVIGRIVRMAGGFPVQRGQRVPAQPGVAAAGPAEQQAAPGTQPALEIARHILLAGHGLIMFMEGQLVRGDQLGEPRRGLALLALQTGVPIVPAAAAGTKPAILLGRWKLPCRWPRVTVIWGEPMRFPTIEHPTMAQVEAVRDEIWAEISRLYEIACSLHAMRGSRPETLHVPPRVGGGLALPVAGPFDEVVTGISDLPPIEVGEGS